MENITGTQRLGVAGIVLRGPRSWRGRGTRSYNRWLYTTTPNTHTDRDTDTDTPVLHLKI